MHKKNLRWSTLAILLGSLLTVGCTQRDYGDLGHVAGTVTLDGKPYPNAMLVFTPEQGGRPSQAITDEAGAYELIYIRTTRGAALGKHSIAITTVPSENGAPGTEKATALKDPIPTRYNARTELIEEVHSGDNQIDFALQSK